MRWLMSLTLVAASTTAHAANIGILCHLTINNQIQQWHLSFDGGQGRYTARIGDRIVKQRQEFQIERGFGANLQPSIQAVKAVVQLSPMEHFLIIDARNMAFLAPLSGMNPRAVGPCETAEFKGL